MRYMSAKERIVKAVHENQRGEVRICDLFYSLTVGGGKPGQSYPCVLIIEKDDEKEESDRY